MRDRTTFSTGPFVGLATLMINVCANSCPVSVPGKPLVVGSPDAAITAAKEAWKSKYSAENVAKSEPYAARFENGEWHVFGTLPSGAIGGTPEASVCAVDGSVSATWYGQ